uniref:Uncharacterized protein n=1 Tax=Helianthus annuus TaxID=4232 RepID=A0A251VP97_HELAN
MFLNPISLVFKSMTALASITLAFCMLLLFDAKLLSSWRSHWKQSLYSYDVEEISGSGGECVV